MKTLKQMKIYFQGDVPWWKSNFFISQPVLFGTWDGVFTSCLINIFGVIVFLRSGWIVSQAGVICAVLIVLSTGLYTLLVLILYLYKNSLKILCSYDCIYFCR